MACVSPYLLAGTTPRGPKPLSAISFPPKPFLKPSQLHYFTKTKTRAPKSLNLTQRTKIRPNCSGAESDKLSSDVRKRAMDAIDSSGRRATLADIVSRSSLNFNEAHKALQALASDTNGFLEVTDGGDIVYVFHRNYQLKLAAKSFWIKIESFLEKAKWAAETLMRVSFGISMAASIIFPLNTVALLMTIAIPGNVNEEIIPSDIIRSIYGRGSLNYVFSMVFGDGDPNRGIEEKRWKMSVHCSTGGVVTAEELAPYLDPETIGKMDDDSYMLPLLLRFDGHPEVDEEGNILYRFPLAKCVARGTVVEKFLWEEKWKFSKFGGEEILEMNFLLFYILVCTLPGIFVLPCVLSLGDGSMGSFLWGIYLHLNRMSSIYIVSFFVIQLVRGFLIREPNAAIVRRNLIREQRAKALELPDPSLKRKLQSARNMAQRTSACKDRIVYSTEREQYDYEKQEWDLRFKAECPS